MNLPATWGSSRAREPVTWCLFTSFLCLFTCLTAFLGERSIYKAFVMSKGHYALLPVWSLPYTVAYHRSLPLPECSACVMDSCKIWELLPHSQASCSCISSASNHTLDGAQLPALSDSQVRSQFDSFESIFVHCAHEIPPYLTKECRSPSASSSPAYAWSKTHQPVPSPRKPPLKLTRTLAVGYSFSLMRLCYRDALYGLHDITSVIEVPMLARLPCFLHGRTGRHPPYCCPRPWIAANLTWGNLLGL